MPLVRSNSPREPSPAALRGCGTVFFTLFAGIGLLGLVVAGKSIVGAARVYSWRATPCTIVESTRTVDGLERIPGSTAGLLIRFRYDVDGTARTSDRLSLGNGVARTTRDIERLLLDYPVGRQAQCWVNPANAAEAVLVRDSLWPALILLVPLVFFAVGIGGIFLVWTASGVPATRSKGLESNLAKRIFFGFFAVIGGTVFTFISLRPALLMLSAHDWPTVPCEIVRSGVKAHTGNKGTTYSVEILYRYKIEAREVYADRFDFIQGSSSGQSGKNAIVRRFPAGGRAACFVNPSDPTDAVLDRGFRPVMWFGLVPLVFLVIGLTGIASTLRRAGGQMRPLEDDDGIVR